MSFCAYVKDPRLRIDLRTTGFREAWDEGLRESAREYRSGPEYREGCGACILRADCDWCPVYACLEHGRPEARIEYLCAVAGEKKRMRRPWMKNDVRYYRIAGITIRVVSDIPFAADTFDRKFKAFEVDGPGEDTVEIRHRFGASSPRLGEPREGTLS